jgi:hypothetical protein
MPATTRSNQRAAQVLSATSFAGRIDDKRQISGAPQFAFLDVPIAIENATGNIIELLELPPGAIVLPELSKVIVDDDFASAATINIGDAADRNRYADAIDVGAPGIVEFWRAAAIPAGYTSRHECVDTGVAATTTTLVTLEVVSLATPAAGSLRVALAYKCL